MKWFSSKKNPAARYLPDVFSAEEQHFAYRLLSSAAVKTENRATSTGAIVIDGKTAFVSSEQEAILETLRKIPDGLTLAQRMDALDIAIENHRGLKPNKAYKWVKGKKLNHAAFDAWWRTSAKLNKSQRNIAVDKFMKENLSSRKYGMPALSGTIGFFGRDPNNNWARECSWNKKNPFLFERVLPLIKRIDAGFKAALPDRYQLQKEFVDKLDPRFVVEGTCFTTITVNKNYRTAAHRDGGDLSQGFSNISVFSNGRKFSGGHLVLPEFNVEICLKPGDLLFVANHEYIHENTAINNDDPESQRLSLVCYAREDLAFAGTLEFEQLRCAFVTEVKKYARMWESKKWFDYLHSNIRGKGTLVDKTRKASILNSEVLKLSQRYEQDALFTSTKWEYLSEIRLDNKSDFEILKALFSAVHFKSPRQDKWIRGNDEDGPTNVDAVYISEDGWCISYCESESGAVKLANNRFNVNAVGKLANSIPKNINRLSRDTFSWLSERLKEAQTTKTPIKVSLVRVPTGIREAPYRIALTTLTKDQLKAATTSARSSTPAITELRRLRTNQSLRSKFYETGNGIALRDEYKNHPQNTWLCDLGWEQVEKRQGKLIASADASIFCRAITIPPSTGQAYLDSQLTHWRNRANNYGSADYKSRYERVGTYSPLAKSLDRSLAGRPHHWKVTPDQIHLRLYGWATSKRNIYKLVRGKTVNHFMSSKAGITDLSWQSKFQSAPICSAQVSIAASLSVWLHRDSTLGTGQAVMSDGEGYWLFQDLSTVVPIRSSDGVERETVKVTKPTILGHLQRSKLDHREDTTPLIRKLRTRAEFIPTPFSEMNGKRFKEYQSPYCKGRANVLAIGGPPASGKTTLMKKIFALADDWSEKRQPVKLLDGYYSKKLNTWTLGVYEDSGGTFQGTDKLSKQVPPQLVKFIRENADKPVNILFEVANVVTSKTLGEIVDCDINFAMLRLMVASSLKESRHNVRGDKQNDQFKKAKETQIENVATNPKLFDSVVEVRNENNHDQATILKMISWFLRRTVKLNTSCSSKNSRRNLGGKGL